MGSIFPKWGNPSQKCSQKQIESPKNVFLGIFLPKNIISGKMGNCLKVLILLGFQRFYLDLWVSQKRIIANTLCHRAISFILFRGKVFIVCKFSVRHKIPISILYLSQNWLLQSNTLSLCITFSVPHKIWILSVNQHL